MGFMSAREVLDSEKDFDILSIKQHGKSLVCTDVKGVSKLSEEILNLRVIRYDVFEDTNWFGGEIPYKYLVLEIETEYK